VTDSRSILTVNIVGPGRVGRSLGRLIASSTGFRVIGIAGPAHLDEAAIFIGCEKAANTLAELEPADLWLLAVPDDAIINVADELADSRGIIAGTAVAHCSGAYPSELLAPLRSRGASIGSLHPVYSFAHPARAVAGFAGTLCAIEGDQTTCALLEKLVITIGGQPFRLAPGSKSAYHAALCIASNYLVVLTHLARQSAALAGLDSAQSLPLITGLMRQTLDNVAALGPEAALTGPILRGDVQTVAAHLQALTTQPELAGYYRELGQATLLWAADRLPPESVQALATLLEPPRPDS